MESAEKIRIRAGLSVSWPVYCRNHAKYECDPNEQHWFATNQDLLTPELDAAIAQANGLISLQEHLADPNSSVRPDVLRLVDLYLVRAKQEMAAGNVQQAWATYQLAIRLNAQWIFDATPSRRMEAGFNEQQVLHEIAFWAADSRVTAHDVNNARLWLEGFWQSLPAFSHSLQIGYAIDRAALDRLLETQPPFTDAASLVAARRFLPGERLRAERALDALYDKALATIGTIGADSFNPVTSLSWARYSELHDNLLQTTPTLNAAVHLAEVPQSWREYVVQARREAELLRLRLIAYHHRVGQYPNNQAEMQSIWDEMQLKRPLSYTPALLGQDISPQPVADFQGVLDVHGAAAVLDDNLNGSDGIDWNSRLVLPLPVMNQDQVQVPLTTPAN